MLAACSSNVETESVSASSSSSATSSSAASGGGGSGGGCPVLPAAGPCPVVPEQAEMAFANVQSLCGLTFDDVDPSDMNSPTLKQSGRVKVCAGCECQQAVFDYYSLYAECPDEVQNSNFAQNLYTIATSCE